MTDRPIRVLLVDDDPMVCQLLRLILSSAADVEVVAEVHDGAQAMAAVHQHFPDVVFVDIRMPVQDGIATTQDLVALPNPPRVVVLTTFDHDDAVIRAMRAGADGFLLKTATPEEITRAVRDTYAGNGVFSPRSAAQLRDHLRASFRPETAQARAALKQLTARELEVARAVAESMSNHEIAAQLHISDATVKSQLATIQDKLGARNRTAVAVLVTQAGLVL